MSGRAGNGESLAPNLERPSLAVARRLPDRAIGLRRGSEVPPRGDPRICYLPFAICLPAPFLRLGADEVIVTVIVFRPKLPATNDPFLTSKPDDW
jgi:hypothetical protein